MPEKKTLQRARKDLREGKSPSTAAGEFVREEIEHVRQGKHGARSTKQAIAIGLSKARRAGIPLPPEGEADRPRARRRTTKASVRKKKTAPKRARAAKKALEREPKRSVVSKRALAAHGKTVARRRSKAAKSRSAKRAAQTRARNTQRRTKKASA